MALSHKPSTHTKPIRLDLLLFNKGIARSRSQASDLIKRGLVAVDGTLIVKPGTRVDLLSSISVRDDAAAQISRGAEKLAAAIKHFAFPVSGRIVLDVGA